MNHDEQLEHRDLLSDRPLSDPFADWVRAAAAVRATTRTLQKLDAPAAYFPGLSEAIPERSGSSGHTPAGG